MSSQQQTLEQRRAAKAWQCVTGALDQARKEASEALEQREKAGELQKVIEELNRDGGKKFLASYAGLARKVPGLIASAGLGQTLAFLRAKGGGCGWDPHEVLYRQVSEWVVGWLGKPGEDLLNVIREHSSEVYRLATSEALAFLLWVKRFAEASLPEPSEVLP